jgi:hypothetical protein
MSAALLPALAALPRTVARRHRRLIARPASRYGPQAGTTTAEYAIGTRVI